MPRVSVKINTGLQIPARRRAGLVIYPGKPQEFDVTDEQLVTLLDDQHLIVNAIDEAEATESSQESDSAESSENTQASDSEGQEDGQDDAQEGDVQTAAEVADEKVNGEDIEQPVADVRTGSDQPEVDPNAKEAATPAIPSTAAAIKKQNRDIVMAQAQSLGIELDYADEKNVTKSVIADAIVAKQGE